MWACISLLELTGEILAVHVNTNKIFLDVSEFAFNHLPKHHCGSC